MLLVDSGGSRNFVARELGNSLEFSVTNTKEFGVSLGNGNKCIV